MVNHSSSLDLDNLCENVRNNVDLSSFSHIDFDNLGKIEKKKRKSKTLAVKKPKKVAKPNQPKPTTPTTRASTRVTTQKDKEVAKPKK